jgi:hypothetical protein
VADITEVGTNQGQLFGTLRDGLESLDYNQEVGFQAYSRVVLPVDGYVFWSPTVRKVFKGALRYSQEIQQNEDELVGFATVLFTSEREIVEFSGPGDTLHVARLGKFRYAFSQQQGFFKQAGLWHYFGHSVYPALETQLLDRPGAIDPAQAVTSNSLALWLQLNSYAAPYYDGFRNTVVLYPSYLVSQNLVPPYGAVHIGQGDTRALQAAPLLTPDRSHYQLAADRVRVTLYGLQNNAALDFIDCVFQYTVDTQNFGIMNMPIVTDGKRPQVELTALAMQKVIEFEIDYYQARVNTIARQLIKSALPTYIVESPST